MINLSNQDKKTVVVLFGGVTTEHEVSLSSASFVISNIDLDKYDVKIIGISKSGEWFLYSGPVEKIQDNSWCEERYIKPVTISLVSKKKGFFVIENDQISDFLKADVIFSVIHGRNGEDGKLPALFEIAKIPFVGCDHLSGAICMDKDLTHIMLKNAGIKVVQHIVLNWFEFERLEKFGEFDVFESKCEEKLNYPMFVKPANAGSSVGIQKAKNKSELKYAISNAFQFDKKIVIEEFVNGREIECAVIGNEDVFASVPGEILPSNDFYDYDAKYRDSNSLLCIPADISDELAEEIKETAKKAYKVLGCSGMARVDFFLTDAQELFLNEPNTIPGFTSISMYPKLLMQSGFEAKEITTKLIQLAIKQHEFESRYNIIK